MGAAKRKRMKWVTSEGKGKGQSEVELSSMLVTFMGKSSPGLYGGAAKMFLKTVPLREESFKKWEASSGSVDKSMMEDFLNGIFRLKINFA